MQIQEKGKILSSQKLRLGRYRHYKNKEYEVLGIARHSESEEEMVVYRTLYGEFGLWVRPLSMFVETIEINGRFIPRFCYLGPLQKPAMTKDAALLLIDTQISMFDPKFPAYNAEPLLSTLQRLLEKARAAQVTVINVQNNGVEGQPDQPGTSGWAIHPRLQPLAGEPVFQKPTASAFTETALHASLQALGINSLFLAGLQTEFCVDATVCQAIELGYAVTVIKDAHSTYDGKQQTASEIIETYNQKFQSIAQTQLVNEIHFKRIC